MRYKQATSQMKTTFEKMWPLSIDSFEPSLRTTQLPKPVDGWWVVNTDDTIHEDGTSGWGITVRDHIRTLQAAAHGSTNYSEINQMELHAIEEGIKLELERGCTKIMLQFDPQNCIGYLKGADVPWNADIMMWRIQHMVGWLESFQAIHILRKQID